MTFREEDMLPYQNVPMEKTPAYLKTVLMQWSMLEPQILDYGGHGTGVESDALSSMSLLDGDTSGGLGGFPYAPADVAAVFEQAVKDNELQDTRIAARRNELKPWINKLFNPPNLKIREEVERLIVEELEKEEVPEKEFNTRDMRGKAAFLADFRMGKKLGRMLGPADYGTTPGKYDYAVHLNRLAGIECFNVEVPKFYFPYDMPFHRVEMIMQAETQLCYIPPEVSQTPASLAPSTAPFPCPTAESSELSSAPLRSSSIAIPTSSKPTSSTLAASRISTYSEFGTTWIKTALPPSRIEKGYTIKDGPWRCQIGSQKPTGRLGRSQDILEISDEKSYAMLVSKIKDGNVRYPSNEHFLIIMHSKQRTTWEKLRNAKALEALELKQRSKDIDAEASAAVVVNEDDDADEDGGPSGETYFEWLCRTNRI